MARIIKRKVSHGKAYEVRWSWYDDSEKRHFGQERFRTLDEAKTKKREMEQAVADGYVPSGTGGKETFAAWAERWFAAHQISLKPSTTRSYRQLLDSSVLPRFGHCRIRSISTADIQVWVVELQKRGLTPPTIKHHVATVRLVLAHASRAKAISHNPALDVLLPTDKSTGRSRPEMHFLEPAEVAKLAAVLPAPYGLMVTFMAYTGLRAGEVSGLTLADLNLLHRRVQIQRTRRKIKGGWEEHLPKNGKTREVPLPQWLATDLRAHLEQHPRANEPEAPLWPGRVNGGAERFVFGAGGLTYDKPWEREAFYRRQFKPALAQAGLPVSMRLHDLRHTYVSIALSQGIPAYRVAAYAGHSMHVMHTTYAHLMNQDRDDDMELLPRPTRAHESQSRMSFRP
jgi:integrase